MVNQYYSDFLISNPLVLTAALILLLIFFEAFYYIRKSIQPSEDFDNKMLKYITHKEKRDSLKYCITFFKEAYDAGGLPVYNDFMAFRLMAAVVFSFYKKTNEAAYAFLRLKKYYDKRYRGKKEKLPDYTEVYIERLIKDGREGDVIGAFCLHCYDEFSKFIEQDKESDEKQDGFDSGSRGSLIERKDARRRNKRPNADLQKFTVLGASLNE